MSYPHLTQDERYQIDILAKAGHGRSDIACLMERHMSTIGWELKWNLRPTGLAAVLGSTAAFVSGYHEGTGVQTLGHGK